MSMKRLTAWLFFLTLLAAALVLPVKDLYAEIAVCTHGVCTMRESDYRQLQKFHAKVMEATQDNEANFEKMARDVEGLQGALARCQSAQAKRPL